MAKRSRRARAGLASLSIVDLQREITRRSRRSHALLKRRTGLAAKLASLDGEIRSLGGSIGPSFSAGSAGGSRRRARNATNLVEALAKVLRGKTMRVADVTDAVQGAGYRTTAKNFRT